MSSVSPSRLSWLAAVGLFFVSGFAALIYQVLWLRELGLLFGNTAYAASATIAVFFAGIAAGGWFWGRRAPRYRRPLRVFGWLELGVAITASFHFLLVDAYHLIWPALYGLAGDSLAVQTAVKAALAFTILFPPAFLMGGTLPVMGQHLIRTPEHLGRTGSLLYAVNTIGGASGAFAAAFILPMALGYTHAYLFAIGLDVMVGLAALAMVARARGMVVAEAPPEPATAAEQVAAAADRGPRFRRGLVWAMSFFSGFVALGVEILWTRMFSQVLQNSVYTYGVVLITFLAALAIGAALANRLARFRLPPVATTAGLLVIAGLAVATTPFSFQTLTGGLAEGAAGMGFAAYIVTVFALGAIIMLPPGLLLGAVFPFLLRSLEGKDTLPGPAMGRLVAANTVGAILGSLVAGFAMLELFGLWNSILIMAGAYVVLGTAVVALHPVRGRLLWVPACLLLLVPVGLSDTARLDNLRLQSGERLVDFRSGSHANVAVTEQDGHRLIRVNNLYRLGGTGAKESEQNQARIPLLLHPQPDDVFFLGLGTGITAGGALDFPVQNLTACELVPEVIDLAERHFDDVTNGLFEDERVRIVAEDGRNCLARSRESYDVIISDLFTPWRSGVASLYTVEHYEIIRDRLADDGLFAQWLPLYQLSREEFEIIARTMEAVFDQVVLWRGDMYPDGPIVALIGQNAETPLDPTPILEHGRTVAQDRDLPDEPVLAAALRFYIGNLGAAEDIPGPGQLNTDDFPVIQYSSARTQRGESDWFTGMNLARYYEDLMEAVPPGRDPYLAGLNDRERGYVLAGLDYYRYAVLHNAGEYQAAEIFLEQFLERTPFEVPPPPETDDRAPTTWETD